MRLATTSFLLSLMVLPLSPALADPAETIGISWAGRGTAGACTAGVDGLAAAYYNPALIGSTGAGFFAGAAGVTNSFSPNSAHHKDGFFAEMGLALPVADLGNFGGLWIGLTALTPPTSFYDIDLYDDEAPVFVRHDSRERRLSLSAALAWHAFGMAGLGVGFEMLPTVDGIVAVDLADPLGDNHLHVDVGYRLSPIIGILFPLPLNLRAGLVWRGQNHTRIRIPVDVEAEGLELAASVGAQAYYVPHRIAFGLEWESPFGVAIEGDITWARYKSMPHPSPGVALLDEAGQDALGGTLPKTHFQNTVSPALSIKFSGWLNAAMGYRFTPATTRNQPGRSNLLDGAEHTVAAGIRIPVLLMTGNPGTIYLTGDFFTTIMVPGRYTKEEFLPDNAGFPSIEFSGYRIGGGLGIELEY